MARRAFTNISVIIVSILATILVASPVAASSVSTTTLVTVGQDGTGAHDAVSKANMTPDGKLIVFSTGARLTSNDSDTAPDVLLYNKNTQKTELISLDAQGQSPSGASSAPSISADGRYIVYRTTAKIQTDKGVTCLNLPCPSIIMYDRTTKQNKLVNRNTLGLPITASYYGEPQVSASGQFVAFMSETSISGNDTNQLADILVRNVQASVTGVVSIDDDGKTHGDISEGYSLSGDGRYVAFQSNAQLTSGDTPHTSDIFIRDIQMFTTRLISKNYDGTPNAASHGSHAPAMSTDGRYVAFTSDSDKVIPGDNNTKNDVFVYDQATHHTQRVSVASNNRQANDNSYEPSISSDGKYVTFSSDAANLVRNDSNATSDIFFHYREHGITRRTSMTSHDQEQATGGDSWRPTISGDGKTITFLSLAGNLHTSALSFGPNLYVNSNPVAQIHYYDPIDWLDSPLF